MFCVVAWWSNLLHYLCSYKVCYTFHRLLATLKCITAMNGLFCVCEVLQSSSAVFFLGIYMFYISIAVLSMSLWLFGWSVTHPHCHVPFRMDSVSGSLRDSEPTSPTSPASPDPLGSKALKATSPIALTQALSSLQSDPAALLRGILLYYHNFCHFHFQLKFGSSNRHVTVRPTCISEWN